MITNELLRHKFEKSLRPGHSRPDITLSTIKTAAHRIREYFESEWITLRPEWLEAARGVCEGTFGEMCPSHFSMGKICCGADTMPIHIDEEKNCFQPKYAESVVKLFSSNIFTGFYWFWGGRLFAGCTSDSLIPQLLNFENHLLSYDIECLLDGAFPRHMLRCHIPWKKLDIYPKRLLPNQTEQQYHAKAHTRKRYNTLHSHWRSRTEHSYGRNRLGRFMAFKDWRWDYRFLHDSIACAMIVLNMELLWDKGPKGMYKPMDEFERKLLDVKVEAHTMQDVRYPFKVKPKKPKLPLARKPNGKRSRPQPVGQNRRTLEEVADSIEVTYVHKKRKFNEK